jgi:transglutaminase-like putative cysteine protease
MIKPLVCFIGTLVFIATYGASSQGQTADKSEGVEKDSFFSARIATSAKKTRIIRLTAHLAAINKSSTPVDKYIYRLTIPPSTESQYSVIESSTTLVAAVKDHKNGCNQYVEFHFPVEAKSDHRIDVSFLVLLRPVDYLRSKSVDHEAVDESEMARWLEPSNLIETDSSEVVLAAKEAFAKVRESQSKESIAKVAYKYPRSILKFKYQKASLGAKKVLNTRVGDCTDFTCLFAALCRTKEIPARKISVFNFGKKTSIEKQVPNHHIAECYLDSHGWIPVDPTLGKGKFNRPVGFGKLSNYFVIINREGAWVWQTKMPKSGYDRSKPKPKMDYTISWSGEVITEGNTGKVTTAYEKLVNGVVKDTAASND